MATEPGYGQFPLRTFLGMELDDVGDGRARARVHISNAHLNPNGFVHGAVVFALVDTGMGKATMSVLPDGQRCASVEVHLRFIRPVSAGDLSAEACVVKRGRSLVHLEARVHDGDERLVATATGTFTVIDAS